jgi:hypothetical protein
MRRIKITASVETLVGPNAQPDLEHRDGAKAAAACS